MKARKARKKWNDVPTSSVSDIAFLLIIFFILTTTMEKLAGIVSEMPSGKRSEVQTQDKTPTIQLHESKIMWNEKAVDMTTLRDELQRRNFREAQGEKKVVLLECSGDNVQYQMFYEVLAAINGAGGMVAIVTEEKDKSEEKGK